MTNQTNTEGGAVALLENDEARPEAAKRVRGHDLDRKSIALILGAVAAGAAVLLGALFSGSTASASACEDAVRTQLRAALMGDQSATGTPGACSGIAQAEIDRITGEILGKAFSG
jgi:hypothetical protein